MYWLAVIQIASGLLIYQFAQKSVPKTINPLGFVAISYAIGFIICAAGAFVSRGGGTGALGHPFVNLGRIAWLCAVGVGVGAALIEVGYFLGYQSGWAVSELPVVVMVVTSVCLLAIGALFLGEPISLFKVAGVAFCGLGLYFLLKSK